MSDPNPDPTAPPDPDRPPLPMIREFDDRTSLWLLEDPENVRGLLEILDAALAGQLDFGRARRINRSFVPADLQKQESDLVYLVPCRAASGREVWLYVLLEHQSQPDPLMSLRLYLYMGQLWDTQRREWDDRKTPAAERRLLPIIPIVYYTGEKQWSAPLSLKELMDLPAELERFVPQWEVLRLNLHETTPETLTQFATAIGWALRVLQAEAAPLTEMERVLKEAMAGLEGLTEEQSGQWLRAAWFLLLLVLHRRPERVLLDVVLEQARSSKFQEPGKEMTMGLSIAQQLRAEGELEATRASLRTVLSVRFGALPADIEQALATATIDAMKGWLRSAATAATLEEVGITQPEAAS